MVRANVTPLLSLVEVKGDIVTYYTFNHSFTSGELATLAVSR